MIVKSKYSIDKKESKINKTRDIITSTKSLMNHEILFKKKILLKKYLIGIYCSNCMLDTTSIKEMLDDNKLNNVKIYTNKNISII